LTPIVEVENEQHTGISGGAQDNEADDNDVQEEAGEEADDDNDEYDKNNPRCVWQLVNTVSNKQFEKLVQDYCTAMGTLAEVRVEYRTNGAFNLIVFVDVSSRGQLRH
jgi:hypothetical protein